MLLLLKFGLRSAARVLLITKYLARYSNFVLLLHDCNDLKRNQEWNAGFRSTSKLVLNFKASLSYNDDDVVKWKT